MPVNVVHNKTQEKHWGTAKELYAKAKERGRKIRDKWRYIMGTYKKIEENS